MTKQMKYSALNLVPIREGSSDIDAIEQMVDFAKHLEQQEYERLWIAEHHNAPNLVSSATAILIQHALSQTTHMRIGSGGIMLPNHAPLIVAEQFGTLKTIYGDRVDLGLGRAPGTDMATASALRRDQHDGVYKFPEEVQQLLKYFGPDSNQGYVKAIPAVNKNVPLYILGSSTDSAHVAAREGLPYVFAGHFAPQQMKEALAIYKELFQPSAYLKEPYIIVALNVIVADTFEESQYLATTQAQVFASILNGRMRKMQPPTDDLGDVLSPREVALAKARLQDSIIGDKASVNQQLDAFIEQYGEIDEIMAVSYIYDTKLQHRSYQYFKEIMDERNQQ
ncbi:MULTISPECIES: LLM class flavin-dependent oxidoreductase [Staphylococcus]|uniref:LLM class flavin-dependent oxidoreductase n=1 Tax=Staphylococcus schleiferi TaxID=1295 RepID=A0ABX0FZG2_STASC|nr:MULTISPECIES: LLM class flavin-dependent oxidoreductase [Staphylococcus]QGS45569.1 MsnO8 family LLM class oxidoreductase [Mammaliicoccus fleurettii]EPD51877.1 luciferase family oxidoreductase, group 1 [Staphylococcus sp. HGB0015]MBF1993908.1 LLM class flavin-dependent oxidoreductase [Staphylococcus schleiferi]MBF2039430.1 LLM class flavin-dependent oxidoreductase [Staphylococcus schleiferi]MBF2101430.1 LLM class flavin-dependent oxidoreductase [Staphylococcus schleiferi]